MQVAAAFRGSFSELLADARLARTEGLTVKPPAKGVRRSVLCGGWVALHVFELVVLLVYGAFPKGPVHAFWWLLATLLAGVLYVRVCFSDPGFLSPLTVQRMADDLGLDVTVAGSDATRGLLEDVEAPLPRMQELLPVPEQPDGPAEPVSTGGKGGSGGGASGGRARVAPVADGAAGSSSMHAAAAAGTEGIELTVSSADVGAAAAAADEEDANEEDGGAAGDAAAEERLRRKLAYKPRIRGVVESGSEEVEAELARERQARLDKAAGPPGLEDYFSGFCEAADMHMPIRAKVTDRHSNLGPTDPAADPVFASCSVSSLRRQDASSPSSTTTATYWATRWVSVITAHSGASSSCRSSPSPNPTQTKPTQPKPEP